MCPGQDRLGTVTRGGEWMRRIPLAQQAFPANSAQIRPPVRPGTPSAPFSHWPLWGLHSYSVMLSSSQAPGHWACSHPGQRLLASPSPVLSVEIHGLVGTCLPWFPCAATSTAQDTEFSGPRGSRALIHIVMCGGTQCRPRCLTRRGLCGIPGPILSAGAFPQ